MHYYHKQTSPLFLVLIGTGIAIFIGGWAVPETWLRATLLASGGVMLLLAMSFHHLAVRDEGEQLLVSFGPLPIFKRRLKYDEIESIERSRSTIMDGWGIHVSPGGGWTWNLWGFDCVDVYRKGHSRLRIGTDDPGGLQEFLQTRIDSDT